MLRSKTTQVVPQAPAPEPRGETYIDEGCELVGQLRFRGGVRIDGRVEGEIRAAKQVVVGESGAILAGIEAESVEVFGTIEGDIQVKNQVTLHKTARVTGEIQTAGIVVEPGARFKGAILIGDDEPAPSSAAKEPASDGGPDSAGQALPGSPSASG